MALGASWVRVDSYEFDSFLAARRPAITHHKPVKKAIKKAHALGHGLVGGFGLGSSAGAAYQNFHQGAPLRRWATVSLAAG